MSTEVDKEKLKELILAARGNETMVEFSAKCGVNAGMLSRLVTGRFKRPVQFGILRSIAAHADPSSGVTLEKLLSANGQEQNGGNDLQEVMSLDGAKVSLSQKMEYIKLTTLELVTGLFLNRGYTISRKMVKDPKELSNSINLGAIQAIIETHGENSENWGICVVPNLDSYYGEETDLLKDTFELQIQNLLLADQADPDVLKGMNIIVAVEGTQTYARYKRDFENYRQNATVYLTLALPRAYGVRGTFKLLRKDGVNRGLQDYPLEDMDEPRD